jgi:hypothetical protein
VLLLKGIGKLVKLVPIYLKRPKSLQTALFASDFRTKFCIHFLFSCACLMSRPSHPHDFNILVISDYPPPPQSYLHVVAVVGLVWSCDPESYAGGSVATGQVKGDSPDVSEIPWSSRLGIGRGADYPSR